MAHEQVEADWSRAQAALRAADVLLDNGLYEDAVSRAYYATLHAARAGLGITGASARTHTGIRRLFGTELVGAGLIEPEWAKVLARAQTARESADYDTVTDLPPERAADVVEQARGFVARIADYLRTHDVGAALDSGSGPG